MTFDLATFLATSRSGTKNRPIEAQAGLLFAGKFG